MSEQRMYRGKTKDGKWVKGWYIEWNGHSYIHCPRNTGSWFDNKRFEVIPSSVGQSTGVFTKSKVEIFGNDIVGGHPHGTVWVVWDDEYACFSCIDIKTGEQYGLFGNEYESCRDAWEVLGNTTDTPKLLEKQT